MATVSLSTAAAVTASATSPKRWSSEPSRIAAQSSASSGQPRAASLFPVGLLVGRGQEGLALGDAQRVGRDPGVELQDRVGGADLGGEEVADGAQEPGSRRTVMGPNGRVLAVLKRIVDGQRGGVAQREQHVVLLLADPAAEHGELDRGLGAGQVPFGLAAAEQGPAHRAVQLPPALGLLVRRGAAARGVTGHQVCPGAEPADRVRRAEPPGLGAQPAQVLPRVAAVGELPVEHPAQPVRADHQVAGAEVPVHQGVRDGSGLVLAEPAQADLERGTGLGEALVQLGQLAERVDPRQSGDLVWVDLVDPGQHLAEAARQPGAGGGVGVVAQQPARDRLPVQALHQQVGPAEGALPVVEQFGHGDAGRPRRDHRGRLDGHVPGRLPGPAARVAEQDEAALGVGVIGPPVAARPDPDVPAFPARAAGHRPDLGDLDARAPQRLQPRGEDAGQLGHDRKTRPRCGGGTRWRTAPPRRP